MRLFRNPQLWLSLVREIWERNRGQNIKQIAASLSFTTTLSLVPMLTVASILISYLPSVDTFGSTGIAHHNNHDNGGDRGGL